MTDTATKNEPSELAKEIAEAIAPKSPMLRSSIARIIDAVLRDHERRQWVSATLARDGVETIFRYDGGRGFAVGIRNGGYVMFPPGTLPINRFDICRPLPAPPTDSK